MESKKTLIGVLLLVSGFAGVNICGTILYIQPESSKYIVLLLLIGFVLFLIGVNLSRKQIKSVHNRFERLNEYDQIFNETRSLDTIIKFKQSFQEFEDLNASFSKLMEKVENNKEMYLHFLQTILNHVNSSILIAEEEGGVEFMNASAIALMGSDKIQRLEDISAINETLAKHLITRDGPENKLVKVVIHDQLYELSIHQAEIEIGGTKKRLITIQNIASEMAQIEMSSWQKLIKVITHEIMNSLTPIVSISNSLKGNLENNVTEEDVKDIFEGINLIADRSEGLLNFVDNYRSLTHIPKPKFELVSIRELLKKIEYLLAPKFENYRVHFRMEIPTNDFKITADRSMLEQVIINLIINSIDATKGAIKPTIIIHAFKDLDSKKIRVMDNGAGIPADLMDKIFVPFYTSKKKGNGIGLAFCKYAMLVHKGVLLVKSKPSNTVFELKF